uniref:uncharacterized protein LOC120334164 n=1 Tax=Styela clava TaxID=7725 RepID=UPI0019392777|nr:uncharacterized protein LOC120334164 [Styela clava]
MEMYCFQSRFCWLQLVFILICYSAAVGGLQGKFVFDKNDVSITDESPPLQCLCQPNCGVSADSHVTCNSGDLCQITVLENGDVYAGCTTKDYCEDPGDGTRCCVENLCNTQSLKTPPTNSPGPPTGYATAAQENILVILLCATIVCLVQ